MQRTCVEQEGEGWEPPAHGLTGTTPWNKTSEADQAVIQDHLGTYLYYDPGARVHPSSVVSHAAAGANWSRNNRPQWRDPDASADKSPRRGAQQKL